jgi:hypothetical protein
MLSSGLLVEGKPPTNIKEVVMDVLTAENHGFAVGDKVTVLAGATPATFTISGIAEFANVGHLGAQHLHYLNLKLHKDFWIQEERLT